MKKESRVCLVVVFNHRFDQNIMKLEQIYKNRFSNIYYLVPFYEGPRQDVIAVYDSSDVFQGYFAQALPHIYDNDFSHYIFVADDMLLNPAIDEKNIIQTLELAKDTAYIKEIHELSTVRFQDWMHGIKGLAAFFNVCYRSIYCNYKNELPDYDWAVQAFAKHNIHVGVINQENFQGYDGTFRWQQQTCNNQFLRQLHQIINQQGSVPIPYPLAFGYSDFLVIPTPALRSFSRLCGIFAAMDLFVEIAIPTAMLLSCEVVKTEIDIKLKGKEIWDYRVTDQLYHEHAGVLESLLQSLDRECLYIHPVKLSKWR